MTHQYIQKVDKLAHTSALFICNRAASARASFVHTVPHRHAFIHMHPQYWEGVVQRNELSASSPEL